MKAIDVLRDVGRLVLQTDFGELKGRVKELDQNYPSFSQKFERGGLITTEDRKEVISTIKSLARRERLSLFAILAPFGFGKTAVIEKIITLIGSGEIKFGRREIHPMHIRLNIQNSRDKIVSKILEELGAGGEKDVLEIIYQDIKDDMLIRKVSKEEALDWIKKSLIGRERKATFDMLLSSASNEELISLIERLIGAHEERTGKKVVLILDEFEHAAKGFSIEFLYFLAMIMRYCFERQLKEFVGIVALATTEITEEYQVFRILEEIGAGDVRDRILERHIARDLHLTPESALELISRIVRFYLYSLVSISKSSETWKSVLDKNETYGTELFTYPIDKKLLEYLSFSGLRRTVDTGVIRDFRAYLILVGETINAWLSKLSDKRFKAIIQKGEKLNIKKFWELNEDIRGQSDVQIYLRANEISHTIFKQDVMQFVENQICADMETTFTRVLRGVFSKAIRSGKDRFTEKELVEEYALPQGIIEDFRKSLPSRYQHIVSFEYGNLIIDLELLQDEIVREVGIAPFDPDVEKITIYIYEEIDGTPLREVDFLTLLRKWKVERVPDWSTDEDDPSILIHKTGGKWDSRIFVTNDPKKEDALRDKIKKSGRFDVGFIVNPLGDTKYIVIYPPGLQAQEKEVVEKIEVIADSLAQNRSYLELRKKVDGIITDATDIEKFYLITLKIPSFHKAQHITDYPVEFDQVNFWGEIEFLLKNPSTAIQKRWIESKTGVSVTTDFPFVVSTFLKLVVAYGSETDFEGYEPFRVAQNDRIKSFRKAVKNYGFEKDWTSIPMSADSFIDRIKRSYQEMLPYDESYKRLKKKELLPKVLEKSLDWIKNSVQKKGTLTLSDVSEYFFGVGVEENGKVGWPIWVNGKRAIFLLLALSHYYGDIYLDVRDDKFNLLDPSEVVELRIERVKSRLLEFARGILARKVVLGKDQSLGQAGRFWARLENIERNKRLRRKEKSKFVEDLRKKIEASGFEMIRISGEVDEVTVLGTMDKLMKSSIVEDKYRTVGEYLKELKSCLAVREPDKVILLKFVGELIEEVQNEVTVLQAYERRNKVIENLGELTEAKQLKVTPKVLEKIEKLNERIKRKSGDEWARQFKKELESTITENCKQMLRSQKVDPTPTVSAVHGTIPELKSKFGPEEVKEIDTEVEAIKTKFQTKLDEVRVELNEWKRKCESYSKKKYVPKDIRDELFPLSIRIQKALDELDLDPEERYVESQIKGIEQLISDAQTQVNKAIESVDEKSRKILDLCDKYDYNLVRLLGKEFGTSLSKILFAKKLTKKQEQAMQLLIDVLELGSKHKIPLKLEW